MYSKLSAAAAYAASGRVPGVLEREGDQRYLPLRVHWPRDKVTVLASDPPVLQLDGFLADDECSRFIEDTAASGLLARSGVGSGYASSSSSPARRRSASSERRTSSTLLITGELEASHPRLFEAALRVADLAKRLLAPDEDWGKQGRMPAAEQLCCEWLQVRPFFDSIL